MFDTTVNIYVFAFEALDEHIMEHYRTERLVIVLFMRERVLGKILKNSLKERDFHFFIILHYTTSL